MESTILPTIPLLAFSKTLTLPTKPYLRRRFPRPFPLNQTLQTSFPSRKTRCFRDLDPQGSRELFLFSFASNILRSFSPAAPGSRGLACISSSAALSGSSGGGDGLDGGGGGGGGDGGSSGGETETKSLAAESDEVSNLGSDVIILDVGGMSCGGCSASVKRILESQPQVSSASVNLATETAVVWAIPEVKVTQNWHQQLGEKLANHLTTCGFKSNLRGRGHTIEGEILS